VGWGEGLYHELAWPGGGGGENNSSRSGRVMYVMLVMHD
jgi:hypothetical protein